MKKRLLRFLFAALILITVSVLLSLTGDSDKYVVPDQPPERSVFIKAIDALYDHTEPSEKTGPSETERVESLFTTIDLTDATIDELQDAMDSGRLTSVRLTQMYLDRIVAYDRALKLNSVISIDPTALEQAAQADADRAAGKHGLLLGIPVMVKDNIDVVGMATTCGDSRRRNAVAATDSTVIAKMRAEGAVILGKTNLSQYAASGSHSRSAIGGRVHNAYDLTRTPAGSSGGSAVAVTCNFCTVALGTDTGSSIRRPSVYAGIFGLRPSFGLVGRGGMYVTDQIHDTIGPMCRSAGDLALLLDVISGTDSRDKRSADADSLLPDSGYRSTADNASLEGKRIGYLSNSFKYDSTQPSPLLSDMIENAKSIFINEGAELVDISALLPERMIRGISSYSQSSRTKITDILKENDIDAVMYLPQMKPPEKETSAEYGSNNYAFYINIFGPKCGLPDIAVPMGICDTDAGYPIGMPVGFCMFSGYGNDAELISIAAAFEKASGARVPPKTVPPLPDEDLAQFADELIEKCEQRLSFDNGPEKIRLLAALLSLKSLRMKTTEELVSVTLDDTLITESGTISVSTETYYNAVRILAEEYDIYF